MVNDNNSVNNNNNAANNNNASTGVVTIKLELGDEHIDTMWRLVEVLSNISLPSLHVVIQRMSVAPTSRASSPLPATLLHVYDYGDDWHVRVSATGFAHTRPHNHRARCISVTRAGPPEDVGGISGYIDCLKVLDDPNHADHAMRTVWVAEMTGCGPGGFDPKWFDIDTVNAELSVLPIGTGTLLRRRHVHSQRQARRR
eukprot:jgi/Chlat1/7906/Chrsp68S07381